MGKFETVDIIFGILYTTGAILLLVASYMLYIKRYKNNKLLAVNEVTFTTSRYNVFKKKTQFLIELSGNMHVKLVLLDEQEQELEVLLEDELYQGENVTDFDPSNLEDGNYYLSLKTEGTSILRRIQIAKT